ncbi:GNAT family N-acetyltransferase [Candidatus Poribacteria bacterium]|nr:GNAT family N-acetyltransferase [Candidatus Poribacteria bacterium]
MEYRALKSDEFEAWLDHVTHVFSGGRQYFSNHWYNDPWKDFEGIRIAVDDGQIVSTVRVFIRKMYFHGEQITVGGIGEVSTRTEYRKKGIATRLLLDSIEFMESRDIAISMLHGSQRIYSIEGWEKVDRYIAQKSLIGKEQNEWNIRQVNFDDKNEVMQLSDLYHNYSQRFNGVFVRDELDYWTEWVKTESSNLWIAERNGSIEGYIAVNHRDRQLSVKEFAASDSVYIDGSDNLFFETIISDLISKLGEEEIEIDYPAPIGDGFNSPVVNKYGSTMYRVIQPTQFKEEIQQELSKALPNLMHSQTAPNAKEIQSHHIFWTTDGF